MATRRKYEREFKIEAVRMIVLQGRTINDVARSFGIHPNIVTKWKVQFAELVSGPAQGVGLTQEEELHQLRRKLADVTMERDILKKAIAIFSKEPG
jgi:transposase